MRSARDASLLLVGSVPLDSADAVFRRCGETLGPHLAALPDGEVGDRSIWVVCQAYRVFHEHPDLETVARPSDPDPDKAWIPKGFSEGIWSFRTRPGVDRVDFDDLRYASWARDSYEEFLRLRDAGEISEDLRFQVSLPTPAGGLSFFFHDPGELRRHLPPYEDAMLREVERIASAIPAEDLAIQWDVCWEVLEIDGAPLPWALPDPWERYLDSLPRLNGAVPEGALLGHHLCYADLGHQHYIEPTDLATCVRMANATVAASPRSVDWIHMPVPRDRDDDAFFAPLGDLDVGDTRIFLGLIHHGDGEAGSRRRLEVAKRHLDGFGLATECGFGRRAPETLDALLDLHLTLVR